MIGAASLEIPALESKGGKVPCRIWFQGSKL